MLQAGVATKDMDPQWMSSISWYVLCIFGLQSVFNYLLGSDNAASQMAQQMGQMGPGAGAGMFGPGVDPHKQFLGEAENLAVLAHHYTLEGVEKRLLDTLDKIAFCNLICGRAHNQRSFGNILTLCVGLPDGEVHLYVHQHLLCKFGRFFKAHCKPDWVDPEDPFIDLPGNDVDIIKTMLHWVYTEKICIPGPVLDATEEAQSLEEALKTASRLLVQLYLLGGKYEIPGMHNDILDALHHRSIDHGFSELLIPFIYEKTPRHDPLRRLAVSISMSRYDDFVEGLFPKAVELCLPFRVDLRDLHDEKHEEYFDKISDHHISGLNPSYLDGPQELLARTMEHGDDDFAEDTINIWKKRKFTPVSRCTSTTTQRSTLEVLTGRYFHLELS
ncbi:hypothetical protein G7Y89_g1560 [Cudoniella acicularis]|uniref:ER membrane protein complex subunit 3 n=1 Tax=Cudoniella acicularis TaxID=354080 RepID=A0A8H4RV17_9HELO|nr:hypothetical protein G7Y89_g1560 [Cudoniella acicularis]